MIQRRIGLSIHQEPGWKLLFFYDMEICIKVDGRSACNIHRFRSEYRIRDSRMFVLSSLHLFAEPNSLLSNAACSKHSLIIEHSLLWIEDLLPSGFQTFMNQRMHPMRTPVGMIHVVPLILRCVLDSPILRKRKVIWTVWAFSTE